MLPIKSSIKLTTKDKSQIVLAGDVGATKTNLALFKTKGNAMVSIAKKDFASKEC
jgi:hypothetical protein